MINLKINTWLGQVFLAGLVLELQRVCKYTHSNADFAEELFWDFARFLQWLVQGASILNHPINFIWHSFKQKPRGRVVFF